MITTLISFIGYYLIPPIAFYLFFFYVYFTNRKERRKSKKYNYDLEIETMGSIIFTLTFTIIYYLIISFI